jgi:hypothetical protein
MAGAIVAPHYIASAERAIDQAAFPSIIASWHSGTVLPQRRSNSARSNESCLLRSIALVLVGPNCAPPIRLVLHWPRPGLGNHRVESRTVESSDISLAVDILYGYKQRVAAFDENRDGRGLLLVNRNDASARPAPSDSNR